MGKQFLLPHNIFIIYNFFEKTKNKDWKENPFSPYKTFGEIKVKIGKNISNLNFYQADIPFSKKIKPDYVIKYLKNRDYRNYYGGQSLFYTLVAQNNQDEWVEDEIYQNSKNTFNVIHTQFTLIFYSLSHNDNQNVSDTKYFNTYKILTDGNNYVLRFEIVLNNMDIDQDIDIIVYLNMIIRLLDAIHKKFNVEFNLEVIKN